VDLSLRRAIVPSTDESVVRLLFAGRLLGLKGLSMAVGAMARLKSQGYAVQLDIAGEGPLRTFLTQRIRVLGLTNEVRLLGSLPRAELLCRYGQADLFLFPSLHDSGGTVVLEALSRGLPVICLDLGGPPNFIDDTCGAVVATRGRSRLEVEKALADSVARIIAEPGALKRLSAGAAKRAQDRSWERLVRAAYTLVHRELGWLPAIV